MTTLNKNKIKNVKVGIMTEEHSKRFFRDYDEEVFQAEIILDIGEGKNYRTMGHFRFSEYGGVYGFLMNSEKEIGKRAYRKVIQQLNKIGRHKVNEILGAV